MAKDDYHVIVYQILSYLYTQLKSGESVDADLLKHDSMYLGINERYWQYIIVNMLDQGLIVGPAVEKAWGKDVMISGLEDTQITPAGIEYLCDNSFLKKTVKFLKETKAIVPFM